MPQNKKQLATFYEDMKMRKLVAFLSAAALTTAMGATALASSADVYVVNFRSDTSSESQALDSQLNSALGLLQGNVEQVVIDTSNAAKWEKGAHEAFDRDIVPVFNKWVGLPGFAAVVDAGSKRVIGCVNSTFSASEMADEIRRMASKAQGSAYFSRTSTRTKTTSCPPAHNQPPR